MLTYISLLQRLPEDGISEPKSVGLDILYKVYHRVHILDGIVSGVLVCGITVCGTV